MATITLPAVFASAAKQTDGSTAVPFVNPTDPALPRYTPPKGHAGVNPAGGWAGTIPETVPTAWPDRSAPGAPYSPANAARPPSPELYNGGFTKPTSAAAGIPGVYTPAGSYVGDISLLSTVTASPATNWTAGQYINTGGGPFRWNGTAWAATTSGVTPQAGETPEAAGAATGATAGTPGEWTPAGAEAPQLMADAPALEGEPAWATGEYALLRNGSTHIHWDGEKWASGNAP